MAQRFIDKANLQPIPKAMTFGRCGGFTLVELVVVLAILGLLSAMLVPAFGRTLQGQRMESFLYQLHSDMRYAQAQAQKAGTFVEVSFYRSGDGGDLYLIRNQASQERLKSVDVPPGIKIDYNDNTKAVFDSMGGILANGHFTFVQGRTRRYIYFYQTGRIRITDVYRAD